MRTIKNRNENGRPPLPSIEKKSYRVTVKLAPPEYYLLKGKAMSAGVNLSEMIRQSIESCNIKERLNKEHTRLILQLTAMGNNLNQLTKRAHQEGVLRVKTECEGLANDMDNLIKLIEYDR